MVVTCFCNVLKLLLQYFNHLNICRLFLLAVVTVVKMKNFCLVKYTFYSNRRCHMLTGAIYMML